MSTIIQPGSPDASETILTKLKAALHADGDFPVRARVVHELRRLVSDPNTNLEKVVEVILNEPSLGTRVLHLVNSVYYCRSQQVMTISQAVVQVGMKALSDLCSGFVLMQRFSPAAQRGGVFADNVKKCILTSLLSSSLAHEFGEGEQSEQGYLAGTFIAIGPLLLAYYFPQVYESAEKRAKSRNISVPESLFQVLGLTPTALSLGVVEALIIPDFYRALLTEAYDFFTGKTTVNSNPTPRKMAVVLSTAVKLSEAIIDCNDANNFGIILNQIADQAGCRSSRLRERLISLPDDFKQHCRMIEMGFMSLPEAFVTYLKEGKDLEDAPKDPDNSVGDEFSFYIDEIRQAIANRETMSSIITTAMESLVFGQNFDRVILLYSDPTNSFLQAKMSLGKPLNIDIKSMRRDIHSVESENVADVKAFCSGEVQIYGDPVLQDGWPFAVIPIGAGDNALGVIYADMIEKPGSNAQPLDGNIQLALHMLAELLEEAVSVNS